MLWPETVLNVLEWLIDLETSRSWLVLAARFPGASVSRPRGSSVPKIKIPAAIPVGVFVLISRFAASPSLSLSPSCPPLPSHRRINASQIKLRSDAFMTELCPLRDTRRLLGMVGLEMAKTSLNDALNQIQADILCDFFICSMWWVR